MVCHSALISPCFVLCIWGYVRLANAYVTFSVSVPTNISSYIVNGSISWGRNQITIVNDIQTWFQAKYKCRKERNLGHLETAPTSYSRLDIVTQTIREHNLTSRTFWHGAFRPYDHIVTWADVKCSNLNYDILNSSTADNKQCAVLDFLDVYGPPELRAVSCFEEHPYLCYDWLEDPEIYLYEGFEIITSEHLFQTILENQTLENCTNGCVSENLKCIGFTYNFSTSECSQHILDAGYGHINYTIGRISDNVTHGVKWALYSVYIDDQTIPNSAANNTFPDCGLSPIPDNYCLMNEMTAEEAETIAEEIARNLTVKEASTSKYQRKYTSARDKRGSSKTFGAFAVIFISVVFALPILADVVTYQEKIEKQKLKKRIRKSKKVEELPDVQM